MSYIHTCYCRNANVSKFTTEPNIKSARRTCKGLNYAEKGEKEKSAQCIVILDNNVKNQ